MAEHVCSSIECIELVREGDRSNEMVATTLSLLRFK